MKTASAALAAHLQQEVTSLATCWKVKRTDGTILGFTDYSRALNVDVGDGDESITYKAPTGYSRDDLRGASDLRVPKMRLEGFLGGGLAALFQGATAGLFHEGGLVGRTAVPGRRAPAGLFAGAA